MKLLTFITLLLPLLSFSKHKINNYIDFKWKLSRTQLKYIEEHKVISDAEVKTDGDKQSFKLRAVALHKKSCKKALRKLSQLENYENWVSFIESSTYLEKSNLFTIIADHPLLPYKMRIHIIVKRPTKTGRYNFTFPTGMFSGLIGHFTIKDYDKKCLFSASSSWSGKYTKIPSLVIEIFSETLSRLGGEVLMRKTQ